MLQAIRDKVTGWIAYGIIFLISVPFALWGVNSYLGGGEAIPAASVNGEEISSNQLDQAYANYRQRLMQLFGGNIPESFGNEALLKRQVLEQLIEEFALRQYAERQRYRISDAELSRRIQGMEVFQRDGQFDVSVYQAQLSSQGYNPQGFELELRRTQAIDQLRNGIIATAFIVPASKIQFVSLATQSRKIRTLSRSIDVKSIQVDAGDIEAHYKAQSTRYQTPEQVKIDYIELSLEKIKSGIVVDQADLLNRYQNTLDTFTSQETREASHILIKLGNDATSEESDQSLAQITELRQRIENGESFAELAQAYSQDPGSSEDGGNLGEIERGVMVQGFESALFSMQPGELSEPLRTSFGWHLIRLNGIRGGEVQPFESVRTELGDEVKTELAESRIFDLTENLANLVYEQPDSLLVAAQQLQLPVETSAWFSRLSGEGIAAEAIIREQAFSAEVLKQGLNSAALELGNDRVVFIRLNQYRPAEARPLPEVSDAIRLELATQKASRQSLEVGEQALQALNSGKSLESLAQEWSSSVQEHGFVNRRQSDIDGNLLNKAFSMPRPDQGLVYRGVARGNGDYTIIELSAVISNDANVDQQAIDNLADAVTNAEYQSILKLLTNRAEVVRNPQQDP